jgi:hypothetical protein
MEEGGDMGKSLVNGWAVDILMAFFFGWLAKGTDLLCHEITKSKKKLAKGLLFAM